MRLVLACLVAFSVLNVFSSLNAFGKTVALTVDDAPMGTGWLYSGPMRTERFIAIFGEQKIQAAFFCNTVHLGFNNGRERLASYARAGHVIANHTRSHLSANAVPVAKFLNEIDEADKALNQFSTFKKWFRYPYLKEGASVGVRDQIREHLKSLGYINGFVTVDNYDYAINEFVQNALKKNQKPDLDKACAFLSELNLTGLDEQERLAKDYFGRTTPQVLLMHENDLEAFCLDRSIKDLKKNGWKFVAPATAFADPLLTMEPNTMWLEAGRIAAVVAAKDGTKFQAKWDRPGVLQQELIRRDIVPRFRSLHRSK